MIFLKRLSVVVCLLPLATFAQLVNNGAAISIAENTTLTISAELNNQGTLINDGSILAEYDFTSTTYSGNGSLTLAGANQTLNIQDTVASLALYGSGVHTLASPLVVSNSIGFSSSRLLTNGFLNLYGATALSDPNEFSYLVGNVSFTSTSIDFFPIGSATRYAPIRIYNLDPSLTTIGFVESSPEGVAGKNLLEVSSGHYWFVDGNQASLNVTLPVSDETIAPDPNELTVAYSLDSTTFSGVIDRTIAGTLDSGSVVSNQPTGSGLYTLGRYFDESLREADSLALIALYEATGGTSWANRSGWGENPLEGWYGLTLSQKRPVQLDLSENNLVGEFSELSALDSLHTLDLSNNELVNLPDLTGLDNLSFVNISGNELGFAPIEKNLAIANLTYSPQDSVLSFFETLEEQGTTYTFDRQVSGSDNSYIWFKATETDTVQLSSTTSVQDLFVNAFSNEGFYFTKVNSGVIPELELTTRPIFLKVSSLQRDSLSLLSIYNKMSGDDWQSTNWKTANLSAWDGVSFGSSRVTGLELPSHNLSGRVPRDILDIRGLVTIDLSDNSIDAIPNFNSLPALTSLDLSANKLQFGDLEPNVAVEGIDYSPQKAVGGVLNDTLPAGSSVEFSIAVEGSSNKYQWSYNGPSGAFDIGGAVGPDYTIEELDYGTMGTYQLAVTSDLVPGLTLQSATKNILASGNVTVVAVDVNGQPVVEGSAYLLRVRAGQPYDSIGEVRGSAEGYIFENVVLGDYLAGIDPDLDNFLPTYYPSTDLWTEAEQLEIRGEVKDTIELVGEPLNSGIGEGQVLGVIESEFVEEDASGSRVHARRKVKRAGCSVRRFVRGGRTDQEDGKFELVAYVQSDDEGRFEFDGLESGLYRFNVEYPGVPMDEDSFVEFEFLEGSEDNILVLEVLITEDKVTVVKVEQLGFFRKYFKGLQVYPNPADEFVSISYDQLMSDKVEVELMGLSGQILASQRVVTGYNHEIQFDVSNLKDGLYLLHFSDPDAKSNTIVTYKVFVNHK